MICGVGWRNRRVDPARCLAVVACAVCCASGIAACGASPRRTLDPASLGAQIASQLNARYPGVNAQVTCPGGIAATAGQPFVCRADVDGQAVRLKGTVTAPGGSFTVVPEEAIVGVAAIVTHLVEGISARTGHKPSVDCGVKPVLVVAVGGSFRCSATFAGQKPRPVTVTVVSLQGAVRYTLAA
jgi:hypothetical protein